jgi:hypothetical protein
MKVLRTLAAARSVRHKHVFNVRQKDTGTHGGKTWLAFGLRRDLLTSIVSSQFEHSSPAPCLALAHGAS